MTLSRWSARTPSATFPAVQRPVEEGTTDVPGRLLNMFNLTAGLTAILWYAFGAIPIFLGVVATLDLPPHVTTSWFFITFLTAAAGTILLSIHYRQPIAIGWSLPALVFLGTAGAKSGIEQLAGATILAGAVIAILGLLGVSERLTRWLPQSIVLGMFAGSILHYGTGIFVQFDAQPAVVGSAIAGYVAARALNRAWLPAVGGAVLSGMLVAAISGQVHFAAFNFAAPELVAVTPSWSINSFLTLSLPLVILVIGTGNIQGVGVLISQGYRPPVTPMTVAIGLLSVVNGLFGGHPASIQSAGTAILGGSEAGPRERRYVAAVIAGAGCIVLAATASTASALLYVLPANLVATLAGLAILSTLMSAIERTATSDLRLGSFFALLIASSPLTILGIGAPLWAIAGGLAVSLALERPALIAGLRGDRAEPKESTRTIACASSA